MNALCLNDSLVSQYLKYILNSEFDKKKVRNLLKYIHPFIVSVNQHPIFQDPAIMQQINNDPLLNIVDDMNSEELVGLTSLKLQLVDNSGSNDFTSVNVAPLLANSEKIDMLISATYENSKGKDKAIFHIKALLSDAKWIKITDGYISENPSQWNKNKILLNNLLPKVTMDITIVSEAFSKKREVESLYTDWTVKAEEISNNIHDRYIETDKLKILLSSGLYNLSETSTKDMTYMVKLK